MVHKERISFAMLKPFLLFLYLEVTYCDLQTKDNIGNYVVEISSIEDCKGPFKKTIASQNITLVSESNGGNTIFGRFTLLQDIKKPQVKIHVQQVTKKGFLTVFKRHDRNVCDCASCAKKLYSMVAKFKTFDNECNVEKGTTDFTIKPNNWVHDLLGDIFFYVKFRIRLTGFVTKANLLCVSVMGEIKKI